MSETGPKLSHDIEDADFGAFVEVSMSEAEQLGMFEEDAVTLEDVEAAGLDLEGEPDGAQ